MAFSEKKDETTRDADLIYYFKLGDRAAFDVLVEKYQFRIMRIINRYVHDMSESNDLTQEVFIRAFQSMDKFRGDSSFYTWLYRIAVNTAKNYLMMKSKEGGANNTLWYLMESGGLGAGNGTDTPEDILILHETEHQFEDVLHHLPPELRTAITLRDREGRSYEDIAMIMDCPIGTVRSRIFRARIAINRGMDNKPTTG